MYLVDSFKDGYVLIVDGAGYSTEFLAGSIQEGEVIALEMNRPEMRQQLAEYRFNFEVAGIDVGGMQIKTDRESQGQVGNAFVSLTNDLVPDVDFKAANGWGTINKEQIKPVAKAVAAHSRGCFRGERRVAELIDGAQTLAEIAAIDVQAAFDAVYRTAYAEVMEAAGA